MERLSNIELGTFSRLFNRGGYVLEFSTNDFDAFTMSSGGVGLCGQYKMSEGKALSGYLNEGLDVDKVKLLKDLVG